MAIKVHPTAFVDEGASVGDFTAIWHFCHVESGAVIGENNNLGQNCYVGRTGVVGNGCRLGNSVSVWSHVELEDFVFCAPFMVFTHIAFPRAAVSRRQVFVKTRVGTGATLGANCTVVPGVAVGRGAFVGAGATLTRDCPDWALLIGSPARQVGWVSAYGDKIPLPLSGSGEWVCPVTEDRYVLADDQLTRIPGPEDILAYVPGRELQRVTARA
ncbi:acyltransferase [Brevundimonas fluminis]|uniref:acyltransferase n=1 Tax=Brevundimonas fluminis TaxID=2487274 RepID=UPI000F658565|nr:acyltransferase [Brevundimonas fluminis]